MFPDICTSLSRLQIPSSPLVPVGGSAALLAYLPMRDPKGEEDLDVTSWQLILPLGLQHYARLLKLPAVIGTY